MSQLIVKIREITEVLPHPNADRLDILKIDHWQTIYNKDEFKAGDQCVYFPPDTVFPEDVAEYLGILNYTSPLGKVNGIRPPGVRVRAIRLRGEESFGLVITIDALDNVMQTFPVEEEDSDEPPAFLEVGSDVAFLFGVTKYTPPEPCRDGDAASPHPRFHAYTGIENIRNFGNIIQEGEEVIFTEKMHGMNARVGKIKTVDDATGDVVWEYMCGSHGVRRKEFDAKEVRSQFWNILTDPVKALLDELCNNENNVVLFGEIFGPGVQDMQYGLKGKIFRVFDLSVNMKYLGYEEKTAAFNAHSVIPVPILYRGEFSWDKVNEFTSGPTTMCDPDDAGKFKGREGIVITPVVERFDVEVGGDGRVILKSISADYHARKGGTEFQ
jgi:RNA ligase (TIGR02306 family)